MNYRVSKKLFAQALSVRWRRFLEHHYHRPKIVNTQKLTEGTEVTFLKVTSVIFDKGDFHHLLAG